MEKDILRMQFLSGVITEGQYKEKLNENLFYKLIGKILGVEEDEDEIEDLPRKSEYDNLTDEQAKKAYTELAKKTNGLGDTHGDFDASAWVSGYSYAMDVLKDKYPHINFSAKNESLNESMIGGIVGIGAINQIPPRAKADYETAFEHFLGRKYGLNEVEDEVEDEMVDSNMLKSYINKLIDLADDYEYTPEMVDELENLKNTLPSGSMSNEDALNIAQKTIDITKDDIDAAEALNQAISGDYELGEGKEVEEPTNY
jgi:uncharacterized protein (UPF0305 family)